MQHHLIAGEETSKPGEPLAVHHPTTKEVVEASLQTGGGGWMPAQPRVVLVGGAYRGRVGEPGAVVEQGEREASLRVEGGAGRRSGHGAVRRWSDP
jgi:hypothetical protein